MKTNRKYKDVQNPIIQNNSILINNKLLYLKVSIFRII